LDSDHRILSAKINVSLRTKKRAANIRRKYNSERLKEADTKVKFELELNNRFQLLQNADPDSHQVQQWYDNFEKAVELTSESILGVKRHPKCPSWVSENTIKLRIELDNARRKFRQRRTDATRKKWREAAELVAESYQKDAKDRLNNQLDELKRASEHKNLKRTWQIINKISGKGEKKIAKVKKLNGESPTSQNELLKEWSTYFEALLNAKIASTVTPPEPAAKDLPICSDDFSLAEVIDAIEHLHENKAPGPDHAITAEVLKNGGSYIRQLIHHICNQVYTSNTALKQWTTNVIVPVPKKGNLQLMSNYRGISLMSIAAKVYNKMINNRLMPEVDKLLRPNQAGFRMGRGCIQQVHILRRIFEGAKAKHLPLFATFIDFKKAFDSINRDMMFAILRHYGIPERIVHAIRTLYDHSTSKVLIEGKLSEEFKTNTGVLQGDVLAPTLFIIVIDYVMRNAEDSFGFTTHQRLSARKPARKLNDLDYADDIALLEESLERAQRQLERTSSEASKVGLEINVDKTKLMIVDAPLYGPHQTLSLNGEYIEVVSDFKYLGSMMASSERDMRIRKGQAWGAFWKLEKIWKANEIPIELKINIFKSSVLTILLYGSETWIINKQENKALDSFVTSCCRIMLNIKRQDHISNDELIERIKQQTNGRVNLRKLSEYVAGRQLAWVGHMLRRKIKVNGIEQDDLIRTYALYNPAESLGKRNPGTQPRSYQKQIAELINSTITLTPEEIDRAAQNRDTWKKLVLAYTSAIT